MQLVTLFQFLPLAHDHARAVDNPSSSTSTGWVHPVLPPTGGTTFTSSSTWVHPILPPTDGTTSTSPQETTTILTQPLRPTTSASADISLPCGDSPCDLQSSTAQHAAFTAICRHSDCPQAQTPPPYAHPSSTSTSTTSSTTTNTPTAAPGSMYSAFKNYEYFMNLELAKPNRTKGCDRSRLQHRVDWNVLDAEAQASYVKAAKCLHIHTKSIVPGRNSTLTRIDDYVRTFMEHGYNTSFSGLHLHWQRGMLYLYEQALLECGYNGSLPYWDFSKYAPSIHADPIFSYSNDLLGGDGWPAPTHAGTLDYVFGNQRWISGGSGGGCALGEPSQDDDSFSVRLGRPVDARPPSINTTDLYIMSWWPPYANGSILQNMPDPTKYIFWPNLLEPHPRCIERDLNAKTANYITSEYVLHALQCTTFACLLDKVNGGGSTNGTSLVDKYMPLEQAARVSIGGLQHDPFASPSDPLWWLMAANIDRIWALWQAQFPDVTRRFNEVTGTKSPWNINDSSPVSLNDTISFGYTTNTWEEWTVNDVRSTVDSVVGMCYLYQNENPPP